MPRRHNPHHQFLRHSMTVCAMNCRKKLQWGAVWAVAVGLSACGVGEMRSTAEPLPAGKGRIVRPVDGDTAIVDIGGQEESVRFIGIDTPESVAQDRPVECYGPEAKERAAELLPPGTVVRLERDVEARDRYNRLLAYVIRDEDDVFVNRVLVEEGYAESIAFPPNTTRQGELDEAEAGARADRRGLWAVCGGTDVPLSPG